ncbi:hypothetical protein [Rhodococcus sp. NPDC127528]|uniref:hypothetical protein n=1 Tax=unclassified Rhodococcus (in: high G+C Gram-positive bacteria) TaxID=192944 RepID=UPI00363E9634
MWWRDIAALLDDATEQDARAARDSENLAMLVDRHDYWLNSEYSTWTTDPDDPEVKAERARRKRAGLKPPPRPLLIPVACRTPEAVTRLLEQHIADIARSVNPTEKRTVAEYNRLAGITGGQQQ